MAGLFQRIKQAFKVRSLPSSWVYAWGDAAGSSTSMSKPYAQSVWVMRAIKKVAGPIGNVALQHYDEQNNLQKDDSLDQFWTRPAIGLLWPDFVEASIGWLKLAGECFWVLDDTFLAPFPGSRRGAPSPMILVRPDRMRHVVKNEQLVGWELKDGKGNARPLLPEQVVHLKFWNPYDPWRGLGEYEAARIAAEADYSASNFSKAISDANGDQGVYVIAKSGIPTDEQREQIIAQLREKRDMQQRGVFKPMFLTGDISIEDPRVRSVDTAFNEVRRMNRHEIFIAFGVPASMADKMESYSVGSASDWFVLITETCMPTGAKLMAAVSQISSSITGKTITSCLNWDEHPVMQTVRRERMGSIDTLWTKGMPMYLVSDYLDLGLPRYENDDVSYIPFAVGAGGEWGDDPDSEYSEVGSDAMGGVGEEDTEGDDDIERMREALRDRIKEGNGHTCAPTNPADYARWRRLIDLRRPAVKAYQSKVSRVVNEARKEVLAKLEYVASRGPVQRANPVQYLFTLERIRKMMLTETMKAATYTFDLAGKQSYEEMGIDDPWETPATVVQQFSSMRENKVSGLVDELWEKMRDGLQEGFNEGESSAELSARVREIANDFSKSRAKRVAITESNAAYSVARQEAMETSGLPFKRWLTSNNGNVRDAHQLMQGVTIPVTEQFRVVRPETGEEDFVDQPGDPGGAPWNVINCYCVSVAEREAKNE
jgi:phage portal protein BeeE